MEKKAISGGALLAMLGGTGATAAALGSEDHKTLSGILGAGTGTAGGMLGGLLGVFPSLTLQELSGKVKNTKLKAVLSGLSVPANVGVALAGSAGAGYGTGKLADWLDTLG